MPKHSKRFRNILAQVDTKKIYSLQEALGIILQNVSVKFVPSIDVAIKLNLDTTKPEQQLRGTFSLPHPIVKPVRILVIDDTFTKEHAAQCGVDYFGGLDKIDEIKQGWLDFDVIITTAKMMPHLAKLGKVLGPKGLMPNPKLGTVTNDVIKTVIDFKRGKTKYRTDSFGNIHVPIGKADFAVEQLVDNFNAVLKLLQEKKPSAVKGVYIQNISLSSTMGPGLKVQF